MNRYQKGTSYEEFVQKIYHAIVNADFGGGKTIQVEQNIKLSGQSNTKRQIDVYWEYELAGEVFRTAVECKNHASRIKMETVDAFASKLKDLRMSKGIIVSAEGFQSGAIKQADFHGITLVKIDPVKDEDLEGRLQKVTVTIHVASPIKLLSFQPQMTDAVLQQLQTATEGMAEVGGMNDEVFVHDRTTGERKSIQDYQQELASFDKAPGIYEFEETYQDGVFDFCEREYEISGLYVKYESFAPTEETIELDYKDEFVAIMRYISNETGRTLAVLKDGTSKKV